MELLRARDITDFTSDLEFLKNNNKKGGKGGVDAIIIGTPRKNYSSPQNNPGMTSIFPPAQNEMLRRSQIRTIWISTGKALQWNGSFAALKEDQFSTTTSAGAVASMLLDGSTESSSASGSGAGVCSSSCGVVAAGASDPSRCSSPDAAALALTSLPSLFLLGFTSWDFAAGAASTLSCVLLAELCVGRIILARNDPSGAFMLAILVRGLGFWFGAGWAGSEGLDEGLRVLFEGVLPITDVALLVVATLARLGDLIGRASPSFAADEAVVAIAAAGRRTGRVGDLGRGFGLGGDVIGFFAFSSDALALLSTFAGPVTLAPTEIRLCLLVKSFLGSPDGTAGLVKDFPGATVFNGGRLPATDGETGVFGPSDSSFDAVVAAAFDA